MADLAVYYGDIIEEFYHKTLSEWSCHLSEVGRIEQYGEDIAYGFLDAHNSQYDAVKVNFIEVTGRNHKLYQKDSMIGELRRYYNQSKISGHESLVAICFKFNLSQYELYTQRTQPA